MKELNSCEVKEVNGAGVVSDFLNWLADKIDPDKP
jgi:hypothetical protein